MIDRSRPKRRALWIAVALALAPSLAPALASAQERVNISLEKHFPGLIEAYDSEYNGLYRFADFMGVEGRLVDEKELAEWQEKWRVELARATGELEKLRAEPQRDLDFRLRLRLQRHHYFRDRFREEEFKADFGYPPFVLYVQAPKGDDTGTSPEDIKRYGTWFQTEEKTFRTEFAEPLGLEMRSTLPGYAIFLLRGREEYDLYAKELQDEGLYIARAHYDPEYRIGVTYGDKDGAAQDSDEIHSAMHEMVHAFQHAYHVNAGQDTTTGLSTPSWFNEGFAEFLAYRVRMVTKGEKDTVPRMPAGEITALCKKYGEAGARCVLPLVQLTQIRNYGQAASIFAETLAKGGVSVGQPMQLLGLLYRQSDLWMHFLYDGDGGAHRELLLAYVGAVLSDANARDAYARSFAAEEPGVLDAEFVEFLAKHRVEPDAIEKLRATRPDPTTLPFIPPAPGAGKVVRASGAHAPDAVAAPGSESTTLDLGVELRLAGALDLAHSGRWTASATALRALAAEPDLGALADLVARSRERADALVALRTDFLRHMVEKGSRMTLQVGGQRLLARVVDVDDGTVAFEKNSLGIDRVALDEIDPLSLCDAMRGSRSGYAAPPLAAYPYLLAGDGGWELMLDGSPEAAALKGDAPEVARLAKDAGAAGGLLALAALSRPATREEGERALALVADVLERHGADPRVRARRGALRAIASRAAGRTFDPSEVGDPSAGLAGALETLGDGRVRLSYAFDDALELDDFDHDADDSARIEGGSLVLLGATQVTSRLALDAPFSLRMKIRVPVDPDPEKDPRVSLHISGAEAQATSGSWGELTLVGPAGTNGLTGAEWPRNRLFELELVHDGTNLSTRIEGLTSAQIDAHALPGGALGIEVRSERPVYVAELELTGRLGAGNEERARAAHVRRVLASLAL